MEREAFPLPTKERVNRATRVVATKEQVACEVDGEAVILDLKSETYFGLDPVGTRIWDLIQEPARVEDVCQALLEEYEVDPDRCRREVVDLLNEMAEEGIVEIVDGAGDEA